MKKLITLSFLLVFMMMLSGCKQEEKDQVVKVIAPAGGPTLAIAQMIHELDELDGYEIKYDLTTDPAQLGAAISTKSHEIVIAPTNAGASLYNRDSNYRYGGTITFGNLFLVGTVDTPLSEMGDKDIVAFGQSATPSIILTEILKDNDVYDADHISYQADVSTAQTQLLGGNYQYALLAEPVVQATKVRLANLDQPKQLYVIADLQAEYKEMTGKDNYPQAGLFINGDFYDQNKDFVSAFLTKIEESATFANESKEATADYYNTVNDKIENGTIPNLPKPVIVQAIPGSNIGFLSASDSKELMNEYLNLLLGVNANLIGGQLPDDDFYIE